MSYEERGWGWPSHGRDAARPPPGGQDRGNLRHGNATCGVTIGGLRCSRTCPESCRGRCSLLAAVRSRTGYLNGDPRCRRANCAAANPGWGVDGWPSLCAAARWTWPTLRPTTARRHGHRLRGDPAARRPPPGTCCRRQPPRPGGTGGTGRWPAPAAMAWCRPPIAGAGVAARARQLGSSPALAAAADACSQQLRSAAPADSGPAVTGPGDCRVRTADLVEVQAPAAPPRRRLRPARRHRRASSRARCGSSDDLEAGQDALGDIDLTDGRRPRRPRRPTVDGVADHLDGADRTGPREPAAPCPRPWCPVLGGQVDGRPRPHRRPWPTSAPRAAAPASSSRRRSTALDGGRCRPVGPSVDTADEVLARAPTGRRRRRRSAIDSSCPPLAGARDELRRGARRRRPSSSTRPAGSPTLRSGLPHRPPALPGARGNNAEMRSLVAITVQRRRPRRSTTARIAVGRRSSATGDLILLAGPGRSRAPRSSTDLYGWRRREWRYPGTVDTPNFPPIGPAHRRHGRPATPRAGRRRHLRRRRHAQAHPADGHRTGRPSTAAHVHRRERRRAAALPELPRVPSRARTTSSARRCRARSPPPLFDALNTSGRTRSSQLGRRAVRRLAAGAARPRRGRSDRRRERAVGDASGPTGTLRARRRSSSTLEQPRRQQARLLRGHRRLDLTHRDSRTTTSAGPRWQSRSPTRTATETSPYIEGGERATSSTRRARRLRVLFFLPPVRHATSRRSTSRASVPLAPTGPC